MDYQEDDIEGCVQSLAFLDASLDLSQRTYGSKMGEIPDAYWRTLTSDHGSADPDTDAIIKKDTFSTALS